MSQPDVAPIERGPSEPLIRFVSIPDFFNSDIDVSGAVPGGGPEQLVEVINFTMDGIAAEEPDFVIVPGDLFNSRWHLDKSETYYFGPVGTVEEKSAAIDRAAAAYYPPWNDLFTSRDLVVYPAVGDHELGDNDWPPTHAKSYLVPQYRQNFARYFLQTPAGERRFDGTFLDGATPVRPLGTQWEDTAYAVIHGNTLIITLDVFRQDDPSQEVHLQTGSVITTVDQGQLSWLRSVLSAARSSDTIDHIFVQGHTPILTPVRARNSSEIYLEDADGDTGAATELWRLLEEFDVAMYLTGEVHDITASTAGGVHQLVNGSIIGLHPRVNYAVIDVYDDSIDVTIKEIRVVQPEGVTLWSTSGTNNWVRRLRKSALENGFVAVGSMQLRPAAQGGYESVVAADVLECFGTC